jgi:hypothetical protein
MLVIGIIVYFMICFLINAHFSNVHSYQSASNQPLASLNPLSIPQNLAEFRRTCEKIPPRSGKTLTDRDPIRVTALPG